ncbi:phage head completion protein [Paracoccus laeviglucosivorans]|uniref:Phage head-tail joining protein n=1 Tax=Paracoccus laeviglucosivorans TaxID=1197861 RepID=A0A521CIB3_9RHOB|nr:head-tail adaptor protein [Paracoccus laeviglucosivorans]SMO59132.1 Phage head-tail joining protein [Paracoccus laeviglucosivorans]
MRAGAGALRSAEVGAESVVSWRITVRGARAGDLRRPRPEQRLRMVSGRLFRIEAVAESDCKGRYLICHAKEETDA